MPKIKIRVQDNIFNSVYFPYLQDDTHTQIFYGGSSSGKSFFLAQRVVFDMLQGGHNYLCLRKVARYIKKSIFNEITKAISAFGVKSLFAVNGSDMVITGPQGYQILFVGLDDVEKVKSITPARGVITDCWLEEATEASYDDVAQLRKRLRGRAKVKKRLILSFNPVYKTHWIFNEYFAGHWADNDTSYRSEDGRLSILKTTYKDNNHLSPEDVQELESEKDPYYKDVYTLGNWGVLGDVIFTNWHTEDLSGREFDTYNCGCDFGYAKDPAAITKVHLDKRHNTLYILEASYLLKATNDLLAAEIKRLCGYEVVMCDEAEPKSIQELRNYGVQAIPAPKGKDSVNFGIQYLRKLQIVIDKRLTEAVNEFTVYQWQQDKDGNTLPKPIDRDNHIIDSVRYALAYEMGWVPNVRQSAIKMPLAGTM
jgi:phage terminase large subunit